MKDSRSGIGKRLMRLLTSVRTTVVLLVSLALMLLLNVLIPQASVLGPEEFARVALKSRSTRFLLVDLGFGYLSTSPLFLVLLVFFFVNLAAVLISRAGPTWRRTRFRDRKLPALRAWTKAEPDRTAPLPEGSDADRFLARAVETLRGFGYQTHKATDEEGAARAARGERPSLHAVHAVKHRMAPLGFLLFHLSFFLLCAGGFALYLTRFVATAVVVEGQELTELAAAQVLRRPPLGDPPDLHFALEAVEPRFEKGQPLHLGATLRFPDGASQQARINHPARWGSASVLVQQAGLAPVLWLQDSRGFSLDRVLVAATSQSGEPTRVPLAEERFGPRLEAMIQPLGPDEDFPARSELATTGMELRLLDDGQVVFEGTLRPGQAASLPQGRLVLEEIRYWLRVMVVAERGGGLLISGFLLGVVGLVWRLAAYRREVAVVWDARCGTVVGRSEYFALRFQEELDGIYRALFEPADSPGPGRDERTRSGDRLRPTEEDTR